MKLSICLAAAVTDVVVVVVVVVVVRCHVSWRRAKWERDKLVAPKDATHPAVGGTVVLRTWVGSVPGEVEEWWGCTVPHPDRAPSGRWNRKHQRMRRDETIIVRRKTWVKSLEHYVTLGCFFSV